MELLKTGIEYAQLAITGGYIGIPYNKLDCQALVEKVLNDLTGGHYNWKGSNHMWRTGVSERMTCQDAIKRFGEIPPGYWLFTIKYDGGEKERGYHDDLGNAAHVGIKLFDTGPAGAIHSTTGGVQYARCPDEKRWTHCGPCKYLSYQGENASQTKIFERIKYLIEENEQNLNEIRRLIT